MKGNLDEALIWYKKSWKSQDMWPQFHHLCFWEILWVNWYEMHLCTLKFQNHRRSVMFQKAFVRFKSAEFFFTIFRIFPFKKSSFCSARLDWKEAEMFAALLCEQSKWSRTIYTYQRAVVMLMRDKTDLTPAERQTIENLMR